MHGWSLVDFSKYKCVILRFHKGSWLEQVFFHPVRNEARKRVRLGGHGKSTANRQDPDTIEKFGPQLY